jgi:hypothetical protein
MKRRLLLVFNLVFLLSACASFKPPATVDVQKMMEMTREYSAMQTIIALEQSTHTSATPAAAIASALKPLTPVLLGAGYSSYRMACYVDAGTQLIITGRNVDSSWLRVVFGQGQTCFALDKSSKRTYIIPDPTIPLWVFHTTISISGDLSGVAIVAIPSTPTPSRVHPTPTP